VTHITRKQEKQQASATGIAMVLLQRIKT